MENLTFNHEIVKTYLKENHLTIKEFCKICNIKYYNFRQIMKNDLNIYSNVLYRVCKTTKIKLDNLLIFSDNT